MQMNESVSKEPSAFFPVHRQGLMLDQHLVSNKVN